eukprot:TRINITY_DN1717_c0_g1_i1.p1 TRINITY_DN1717_c0_g1~~TRINITY_DN1717_c0_g1_i1.p1  ORF type:complete len:329 (+),score=76.02 TRINITY_DN1717_c0_g1_i1:460-1446(+)
MEFIRDGISLLPDGKNGAWLRMKIAREAEFFRLEKLLKLLRIKYKTTPPAPVDFDNIMGLVGPNYDITFTSLGATGREGPTSLGTHYVDQPHEEQVTVSNGIQTWTVPAHGMYLITAYGASGGDSTENTSTRPGYGAKISASFYLEMDDRIQILVGQMGELARGTSNRAGGGGGGTFVVRDGQPLIVAGGGNGCNWGSWSVNGIDALLEPRTTTLTVTDGRGGGGGGFQNDGNTYSSTEIGGKSFVNGGLGGTGSYASGGFGGGGGAQYEGGGGGGYQGGYIANSNQYSTAYPQYGATSFIAEDGEVDDRSLHTEISHGKVTISFVGV